MLNDFKEFISVNIFLAKLPDFATFGKPETTKSKKSKQICFAETIFLPERRWEEGAVFNGETMTFTFLLKRV